MIRKWEVSAKWNRMWISFRECESNGFKQRTDKKL